MPISSTQVPMLYWDAVIAPQLKTEKYQHLLKQLEEGEYAALHLKKLIGYGLYTIRINDADRILFTTYEHQGIRYLVLLEIILNHDYQKSRFLQPGVLDTYLEKNKKRLDKIIESDFLPLTDDEAKQFKFDKFQKNSYQQVTHYKKQFLSWDDQQNELLNKTLPIFISGVPGTGKTLIAFEFLLKYVKNNLDSTDTIFYVTRSPMLADEMRQSWLSSPEVPKNKLKVHFLSYPELVAHFHPQVKNLRAIGEEEFCQEKQPFDAKMLYQEFRCVCQSEPVENYLNSGVKSSLFKTLNDKAKVLKCYQDYLKHLSENNLIDYSFYPFKVEQAQRSALVVLDEAQDLTAIQFKNAATIAEHGQTLVCADTNQSVKEFMSNRPFALQFLQQQSSCLLTHYHLHYSYRLPDIIAKLGNKILAIRNKIIGGVSDKDEYSQIKLNQLPHNNAHLEWVDPEDKKHQTKLEELKKYCLNHKTAVIIQNESQREAAVKLFETQNVYTAEEIKGLEFENVILYQPFEHADFKEVNCLLSDDDADFKINANRSKQTDDKESLHLVTAINSLFTGVTRTQQGLYVYCEKKHEHRHILRWLKAFTTESVNEKRAVPVKSTSEEWLAFSDKLAMNGNKKQAEQIRVETAMNTLKKSATHSTSSTSTDADKQKIFVDKLLKNFTKNNLTSFMYTQQFEYLLMNVKGSNGLTLFESLRKDFEKYYLVFLQSETFFPLLKRVLQANDFEVAKRLPSEVLFSSEVDKPGLCSTLNKLTQTPVGEEILTILKNSRGDLKDDMQNFANDFLIRLTLNPDAESRKKYYEFIKENQQILEFMSTDLLYKKQLFDHLCLDPAGIEILKLIYERQPDLAKSLPTEILMGINRIQGVNSNIINLCSNPIGMGLTKLFFDANPGHYAGLNTRILTMRGTFKQMTMPSLLWMLASTVAGREIIYKTPDSQPAFTYLSRDQLFKPPENLKSLSVFHCPFYNLLSSQETIAFLHKLLMKRRDLIAGISPELFGCCPGKTQVPTGNQVSSFTVLARDVVGRKLLKFLLDTPDFIKRMIDANSLYLPLNRTQPDMLHGQTPFFSLATREPETLEKIYRELPHLIGQIPQEVLFREVVPLEGHPAVSPFFWFVECKPFQSILLKMFDANPGFYHWLQPAALYSWHFSHEKCTERTMRGFSNLICTAAGCEFLEKIYTKRPDLLDTLTLDIIMQDASKLLITPAGIQLLSFLIDKKPELAKQLTLEHLYAKRYLLARFSNRKFSLCELFHESAAGQALFAKIIQLNLKLKEPNPMFDYALLSMIANK